jgi:hypothetical protein
MERSNKSSIQTKFLDISGVIPDKIPNLFEKCLISLHMCRMKEYRAELADNDSAFRTLIK